MFSSFAPVTLVTSTKSVITFTFVSLQKQRQLPRDQQRVQGLRNGYYGRSCPGLTWTPNYNPPKPALTILMPFGTQSPHATGFYMQNSNLLACLTP